jgi:DNA-binding transcriptional ArsR family regulator
MDGREADVETEEIPAAEAFAILGNETRMEILKRLWESSGPSSFAELRAKAAPDDRGNFSYHLKRLAGRFVKKTDDGYDLRLAGEQVVRAVLTGTITSSPNVSPMQTSERCVYCGAAVEMAYERDVISVRCTDCGGVVSGEFPDGTYMHYQYPPSGLTGRTAEEAIDAAHVLYDAKVAPMMKGICPECASRIDLSHDVCASHHVDESGLCPDCESRYEVWTEFECTHCQYARRAVTWFAALNHPAVVAFYYDHGLEERIPVRKLTWDNERFVNQISVTPVETDPYRFRVTVPVDDETLTVRLDDSLDVRRVERDER